MILDQNATCSLQENYTSSFKAARVSALVVLAILSLVCNVLILFVIYKDKRLKTPANVFIMNMAISDLIYPLLVIPKEIAMIYTNHTWIVKGHLGTFLCKMVHFLQDISTFVSIQSHIAIAIERFCAVMLPLKTFQSSKCNRRLGVIATWLISTVYTSPYFYTFRLLPTKPEGSYVCVHLWEPVFNNYIAQKKYYLTSLIIMYLLPLLLAIVLYSVLLMRLRRRVCLGQSAKRALDQSKQVTNLAITIITVFALSWAPVHIIHMIFIFKWNWSLPCDMDKVWFGAFFLGWMNSLGNPVVHFIFCKNYQRCVKKMFGSLRSRTVTEKI
ncbi:galanin receptor type 1-like [Actinia tenebrosa]|uniref:Galanin receptor type 1-like n=1 Tax=Actinia tenebrosa TaxID=6105 RepID=A0A6P8HBL2_ACTTE|nr:galanin receptor type 1-like [Actinia tenebrosa]